MITTLALLALPAIASSHREAPAIALDPAADITDFYAFRSPEDTSNAVFILNVNPLEPPGGGPNFHRFDDNVLYQVHVDNEGDGEEDISFQVQFETTYTYPETFLYNVGAVSNPANLNMVQTYTVTRVDDGVATTILASGTVAPINVGVASVADGEYSPESETPGSLTTAAIESSGAYRFFAGPRQEGFYVDLEHTFDLLNLASAEGNQNTLLGFNVHSIAIEVPVTSLTKDGLAATEANQNHVISAWATTSRRAVQVRRATGVDTASRGGWVQVARLGNPLVNEVVLPVSQKDIFNAAHPRDDYQFLAYAQHLLLADYMNAILGTSCPTEYDAGLGLGGREDIILAFLTGHPATGTLPSGYALGGAIPGESGKVFGAFEALRVNLEGTGFGQWPDGRYVSDDVVDVALSAVCGYLIDGTFVPDGVDSTGLTYLDSFPFLGDPWSGNDHPSGGHDR
ncbi:MAG: DUF4331 domain-containing protein [Pseudomonadota bacterium]|nr:DUF4331 domain-containing protein [Pseudomonadota bacterium]